MKQKWIPVEKRLPSDFETVVVVVKYGEYYLDYRLAYRWRGKWCAKDPTRILSEKDNITHWMPLPKPPKEDA